MHLKPQSFYVAFVQNVFPSSKIVLKWSTEHGIDTSVFFAQFQTEWTTEIDVIGERVFRRFAFKMSFGRISYICTWPVNHVAKCLNPIIPGTYMLRICAEAYIFPYIVVLRSMQQSPIRQFHFHLSDFISDIWH